MAFYTTQLLGKPSKIKTTSFVTNVKKNLVEAEVIIIIIELNAKPVFVTSHTSHLSMRT